MDFDRQEVAERVRAVLIRAALEAYEDAALRGLCCEGAWEIAMTAVRRLDLSAVLAGRSGEPGSWTPA